jgi:hypothetical protein
MKKPSKKPWYENLESENRVDYFSIIRNLLGAKDFEKLINGEDIECDCDYCVNEHDTKTTPKAKSKPKTKQTKIRSVNEKS